jgi:hypothetical protein
MKKLLVLAVALLATSALAQIDPDVDMMGIYFDTGATVICGELALYTPTNIYVCITNASSAAGISGWEASVEITPPLGIPPTYTLPAGALNVSTAPDFVVGLSTPMPWQPSIPVLTITVTALNADPVYFALDGAWVSSFGGFPGYAAGDDPGDLRSCGFSAGGPGVCAIANMGPDCGVIATEDATWGSVKTLYR